MKIEIELNEKLYEQIRQDNMLAEDMSDDEIQEEVESFLSEISTPAGLSMILENLEYFNQ